MKKLLFILTIIVLFLSSNAWAAATKMYGRSNNLGTTKACDNIGCADLTTGDICDVTTAAGVWYRYVYDSTDTQAESDPLVVEPDDVDSNCSGNGTWSLIAGPYYTNTLTSAAQAQLDARCLESVFGDGIEADDFVKTGTTLTLQAEIPHSDAAIGISGNWEVQDGVHFSFGNDDDASWAWDAAAVVLELRDVSDVPKFWFDLANNSFNVAATTSPKMGLYDSDHSGGADRSDQFVGGFGGNQTTADDEDDVISDVYISAMVDDGDSDGDGAEEYIFEWDGSDYSITLGDAVGDQAAEDLKFDFSTGTANQVDVTSNTGVDELDFQAIALKTTGDIYSVGWTDYGATSTVVGWADTPTKNIWYKKVGNLVYVNFHITGTSNATNVTFTLPYTHANRTNFYAITPCRGQDNSVNITTAVKAVLQPNSDTVTVYSDMGAGVWTNTNTKIVTGQLWYEAQ